MQPYLSHIKALNNHAASLLNSGRHKEALGVFHEALQKLQKLLLAERKSPSDDNLVQDRCNNMILDEEQISTTNKDTGCRAFAQVRLDASFASPVPACSMSSSSEHPPSAGGTANDKKACPDNFIFSHPIVFNLDPFSKDRATMSMVIVFNMALTHHLMSVSPESHQQQSSISTTPPPLSSSAAFPVNSRKSLTKSQRQRIQGALKLYELAFTMQLERDEDQCDYEGDSSGINATFSLALINNCAQCYRVLGFSSQEQRFLDHLLSSILYLREIDFGYEIVELDGFLSNVLYRQTTGCFAPAA